MNELIWITASTFLVSLISFIGLLALIINKKVLQKLLLFLVSLAAGALMGGAFLDLIPEAVKDYKNENVFLYILVGFSIFFIIEKLLHWRHCHTEGCHAHPFAYMNLIGGSIHNFMDGLIIGISFIVDINLGIATTLAVSLHEIPREIGDFAILVYGGFSERKALFLNFITALAAMVGGVTGYFLSQYADSLEKILLAISAGGFIYIAASDLIPEIREEASLKKSLAYYGIFILGILIMYFMKVAMPE